MAREYAQFFSDSKRALGCILYVSHRPHGRINTHQIGNVLDLLAENVVIPDFVRVHGGDRHIAVLESSAGRPLDIWGHHHQLETAGRSILTSLLYILLVYLRGTGTFGRCAQHVRQVGLHALDETFTLGLSQRLVNLSCARDDAFAVCQ